MGRFQVKKQDTFIDMTPMSDVMVLLLTFFMLTATFTKEEPVAVNVPGSVSEIKIPEQDILTIFVDKEGKAFMCFDNPDRQLKLINAMCDHYSSLSLTPEQKKDFANAPTFGTPLNKTKAWLSLEASERNGVLTGAVQKGIEAGIPCDNEVPNALRKGKKTSELALWVDMAREDNVGGKDMRIAIKADKNTPYKSVKSVMDALRSINENRYNLITTLKNGD